MNQRTGIGNTFGFSIDWVVLIREGGGIPSDDGFAFVGTEVEREHLTVKVFANGDFVSAFGVGNGEAVGDFNL
jgi:hypothetical protein